MLILQLHVMHHPRALPWNDASRKLLLSQGEIKQGTPLSGRQDTSFSHSQGFSLLAGFLTWSSSNKLLSTAI